MDKMKVQSLGGSRDESRVYKRGRMGHSHRAKTGHWNISGQVHTCSSPESDGLYSTLFPTCYVDNL